MTESDHFIIQRCLDGRPDAFRHLVRRYQTPVVAYISGRLRDRHLIEETAQETFVRAFFNLSRLRKPEKFYSWILGIASRVSKEQLRKNRKVISIEDIPTPAAAPPDNTGDWELTRAVSQLDDPYRQVVLLRFFSDRSCKEISEALEVPVGTVTKQLSRAYEKLREMTALETASAFFDACLEKNWDEVQKFMPWELTEDIKTALSGLESFSLGEPFQSESGYQGWFIPYELIVDGGETVKRNLALRNDNNAERYIIDGGL